MLATRVAELVADSPQGFEEAIRHGMAQAHARLGNIHGAWVRRQRVVEAGGLRAYRVVLKVAFRPD